MIDSILLKNLTTNIEVEMNKSGSTYLLDTDGIDWGAVEGDHNSYKYPGQIGSLLSSTNLGERTVSITGYVWTPVPIEIMLQYRGDDEGLENYRLTRLEEKKRILNTFINPRQYIRVKVGNFYVDGRPDSSIKYSSAWSDNNEIKCKFTFSLFCNSPMFKQEAIVETVMNGVSGGLRFPLILKNTGVKFGERTNYQLVSVLNSGDIETGVKLTLTAIGDVINPVIENVYTGERIAINKTMTAGEEIVVVTNKGSRDIKGYIGGREFNYFAYWDYTNDWIQLQVGQSLLGYSADASTHQALDVKASVQYGYFALKGQ